MLFVVNILKTQMPNTIILEISHLQTLSLGKGVFIVMKNCLIVVDQLKLVTLCQWKQKWWHRLIFNKITATIVAVYICPLDWGVTTNFFTKLGFNQNQSMRNTITLLMKFNQFKIVFRCSIKNSYWFDNFWL